MQEIMPLDWKEVKVLQLDDNKLLDIRREIEKGEGPEIFWIGEDGMFYFKNQKLIPTNYETKDRIMKEAHQTPYTAHSGSTKIY